MDANKYKKLQQVNWHPVACCATCTHFCRGRKGMGTCGDSRNNYEHLKHKRTHPLPAYEGATCDRWVASSEATRIKEWFGRGEDERP